MAKKILNGIIVDTADASKFYAESAALVTADASVTFTQTFATPTSTVTAASAQTSTLDAPAGGSGATAGAYDTAAHRDAAIAAVNANRADITALFADDLVLRKLINRIIDVLQANGLAL